MGLEEEFTGCDCYLWLRGGHCRSPGPGIRDTAHPFEIKCYKLWLR